MSVSVCVCVCVRACVRDCVSVCAYARAQVCVCACARAGGWMCVCVCFGGVDGCIHLTMLDDVCQCCFLMFVCLPLSTHFPCCKTWRIKNLNQKADPEEDNSPATPAGIRNRDLSITSPAL